jgi:hypothetical protein
MARQQRQPQQQLQQPSSWVRQYHYCYHHCHHQLRLLLPHCDHCSRIRDTSPSPTVGVIPSMSRNVLSRESSDQAMALALHLRTIHATVYETYRCPHSARQRELFGRQAWDILLQNHVECSPKGYRGQPTICLSKQIDGYPTWIIRGKVISGERPLVNWPKQVPFLENSMKPLERNVPPSLGSSSCQ